MDCEINGSGCLSQEFVAIVGWDGAIREGERDLQAYLNPGFLWDLVTGYAFLY